jgi:UDP-GlcNAc:undecaprenyl-phosphate GlcNAc-1-phosphate transferase
MLNFLWGVIATPVSMKLSRTFRLMDVPGGRKTHLEVTPRGAGIVLWTGYLLWALVNPNPGVEVPYAATGATLVFLVGYMDDMKPLPPLKRLLIHLFAAAWVVAPMSVPLSQRVIFMFWIAGCTNAYNFVDGMDGLALSLALVTSLMAFRGGSHYAWLPMCGLIAGVLLWNFPRARTFLGDGGSTFLGYVCSSHLAWDIFPRFFHSGLAVMLAVLVLIGGMPVVDTLFAMARRIVSGRSPFYPDRGHLHHRLLDRKLKVWEALAVIVLLHAGLVAGGYALLLEIGGQSLR